MAKELDQYFDQILWSGAGSLRELLTSPQSFLDANLATTIYDVTAPADAAQPVMLDAQTRQGILTRAGFLAAHSDVDSSGPVPRGVFVLNSHALPASAVASAERAPRAAGGRRHRGPPDDASALRDAPQPVLLQFVPRQHRRRRLRVRGVRRDRGAPHDRERESGGHERRPAGHRRRRRVRRACRSSPRSSSAARRCSAATSSRSIDTRWGRRRARAARRSSRRCRLAFSVDSRMTDAFTVADRGSRVRPAHDGSSRPVKKGPSPMALTFSRRAALLQLASIPITLSLARSLTSADRGRRGPEAARDLHAEQRHEALQLLADRADSGGCRLSADQHADPQRRSSPTTARPTTDSRRRRTSFAVCTSRTA